MSTLNELVTFESQNEYESAYDLSIKRNFSTPKIYSANGDLKKRWYIYFSYRHPKSGKLKRITPFYGNANKYKTKEERLSVLVTYRKGIKSKSCGILGLSKNCSKPIQKKIYVSNPSELCSEGFDFSIERFC